MSTKRCTKCDIEKLLAEFHLQPANKDGHDSRCKACHAAYNRQYYQEHREEYQEHMQQYNREHREERAVHDRQYHEKHREERQEYMRQYYQEHPEVYRAAFRQYRARKLNAEGEYTAEEFIALCEYMDWRCTYCGCELTAETVTADHMIPLSRGGSDYIDNITPACKLCNVSKRNKTVEEFIVYMKGGKL